jgi:hypothetical protein
MRLLDEDGFECYPLSGKSFDGGFVVKDRTLKKDRHGQPYQACASVKYERPSDQDFRDRDRTKNIGILISVNFNFDNTVKIPKPFLIRDEDLEEVARTISRSIRDSDVLYGEQSKKGNIVTDALQIVLDQVQGARVISSFLKGHMFNASISKDDIRVNIELQYFRGRDLVFIDAAFIDVSDYGKKRKFYYNAITNGRDTSSQEISKIIIDLLTIDPDAAKAAAIAMAKKSQGFSVV